MIKRDKKVTIECDVCGRVFDIFVNELDWDNHKLHHSLDSLGNASKTDFPYLTEEELELISVGICKNCF